MFTKGSHHRNISVILITQNLFHQGKFYRDISLNSHYTVALINVRDKKQFMYLANQVYPQYSIILYNAYLDASQQHHDLILDLTQDTNDHLRFRTNVFPTNKYPLTVYPDIGDEACEIKFSYSSRTQYGRT